MKLNMDEPFLEAFNRHVVHMAHKRGIHAIGGASNYVPSSNSAKATETAKKYVIEEKFREANQGFDGSWVVHPLLIETAQKCYYLVIRSSYN